MQGSQILARWGRARGTRLGRLAFSRALGFAVPYTGTIRPEILELEPGRCRVAMKDRRRIRNHLRSVHAIALVNLGEVSSGLALLTGLPQGMRGIVRGLSISYEKKARGLLVATCEAQIPTTTEDQDVEVIAEIRDPEDDVVAIVRVQWRIGPVPPK